MATMSNCRNNVDRLSVWMLWS